MLRLENRNLFSCFKFYKVDYVVNNSLIQILMRTGEAKLVSYYCAMLSENDQIECYAEFLQNISDENERIKCLKAAEMCQLRIEDITKRVVQVMR